MTNLRKKFLILIFSFSLIAIMSSTVFASNNDINVFINDTKVVFNDNYGFPFVDKNDRTQVPLLAVLEAIGADVQWLPDIRSVQIIYNDILTIVPIGTDYIIRNGSIIQNDTVSQISNGRTYLPIKIVMESFGCTVEWVGNTRTVAISSPSNSVVEEVISQEPILTIPDQTVVTLDKSFLYVNDYLSVNWVPSDDVDIYKLEILQNDDLFQEQTFDANTFSYLVQFINPGEYKLRIYSINEQGYSQSSDVYVTVNALDNLEEVYQEPVEVISLTQNQMNSTIGSSSSAMKQSTNISCKATAVAEMISRATGLNCTEQDFYYNSDGMTANVTISNYLNSKGITEYVLEYHTDKNDVSASEQLAKIEESLSRNTPIVVEVTKTIGGNQSSQHWVTIIGGHDYYSYIIADPSSGTVFKLSEKYNLGAHYNSDFGYVALNGGVTSSETIASDTSAYFPAYTGTSTTIVAALNSMGINSSYEYRASIALINGIYNYTGTATQNTEILNLLKSGKLKKFNVSENVATITYYPQYYGTSNSIATALNTIGVDSSYSNRSKIALLNGITNYSGTATQNTMLLNLLKNGILIASK